MPSFETPVNNPDMNDTPRGIWGYTMNADEVARMRREAEKQAGVAERHSISRDTRINGGVYEGRYGGEAIVVDSDKYHEGYDAALATILNKVTLPDGRIDKGEVLMAVFNTVSETMRYDQAAVDEIFQTVAKGQDGKKVALERYVLDGVGVCRHQALFAAQLLEGLKDMGYISGTTSIDRNLIRTAGDKADGHAWVRYTNSAGEVYILDVAQGRAGSLDDFMKERELKGKIWDYARPEDHARKDIESSFNSDTVKRIDHSLVQETKHAERPSEFIRVYKNLMNEVNRAIETAGYIDPSMSAGRLIYTIDSITLMQGLSSKTYSTLRQAADICRQVSAAGRDVRSPYHRNPTAGLTNVRRLLETIEN